MTFVSVKFLLFLTVVTVLYRLITATNRRYLLLVASLVFIGSYSPASLVAVLLFSGFNFWIGRKVAFQKGKLYAPGVSVNVLAVVLFNYLVGINGSVLLSLNGTAFDPGVTLLAIGLSFYSLQHIAYLVDVGNKRIMPENNFGEFLLISIYFPKIVAGPLTLYQDLKPQLHNPLNRDNLMSGINRILLGYFKKMVLADRLAPSVSSVFDYQDDLPGMTILASAILFTIQLYFDFSGYCDIAIGVSRLFGIGLRENFSFPLRSGSVTVFWRRWHQSLIRFFTTYIFYPVNFKFRHLKKGAAAIGIIVTFAISAIWHGIGFTFMAWALCHMLALLAELYVVPLREGATSGRWALGRARALAGRGRGILGSIYVLLTVSLSHIFFRATSATDSIRLMGRVFSTDFIPQDWHPAFFAPLAVGGHQADYFNLTITLLLVAITLLFERRIFSLFDSYRWRVVPILFLLLLIFVFGVFNSGQQFIYMQF